MKKLKGTYKIIVIELGSYLPYLYKRRFFFWWDFVKVGNLEPWPYWGSTLEMQKQYNVPDKRVSFKLKIAKP